MVMRYDKSVTEQISARISQLSDDEIRQIGNCLVCGGVVSTIGVWMPRGNIAKLFDEPRGKFRGLVYGVCDKCSRKKDTINQVEEIIFKQAGITKRMRAETHRRS